MENALVFASLIMGLAVTDVLVSLHRLLRVRRHVKWDWIAVLLTVFVLLSLVQVWWGLAGERAGSITIGQFLPNLLILVLMFLLAAAVLPDNAPPEGVDLGAYYQENAPYIWTLYAAAVAWNAVTNTIERLNRGQDALSALDSNAGELPVFLLMVSLIFVRRRWWHGLALCVLSLMPLIWLGRTLS